MTPAEILGTHGVLIAGSLVVGFLTGAFAMGIIALWLQRRVAR
jgi:hypothetical protein